MTASTPIPGTDARATTDAYHPRSRRALLVSALGGLAATVAGAFGRLGPAQAAVGSPLIIGSQTNSAGTSDTQLQTNSSVIAFKLLQNGPGTALMGYATPASGATRGVYGRTDSPNGFGVQARNAGASGTGAAVQAIGTSNHGIDASTSDVAHYAVRGVNTSSGVALLGESGGGIAVVATTSGGDSAALAATNTAGVPGDGAAIRATGNQNTGVDASTDHYLRNAVRARTSATIAGAVAIHGEVSSVNAGAASVAIRGVHKSTSEHGSGIYGSHDGSGPGVAGHSSSGHGVSGSSDLGNGVSGQAIGGSGVAGSSNGIGVSGVGGLTGVSGQSIGGTGVLGESTGGYGVWGSSTNSFGVYGLSVTGYAGYFGGRVGVREYLDIEEIPTPGNPTGSPAASKARLFVRVTGGKTELCVIFPTGAVHTIKTEV